MAKPEPSVKNLISAIRENKMLKAESIYSSLMSTKAIDKLEDVKKSVGRSMFKEKK